jgi:hypothetical protein
MSILGDAQELYQTVGSTWHSRRSHILAHIAFGLIVFWVCGATFPHVALPGVDPNHIMSDPWYKLAKDSGFIYIAIFIPFFVAGIYVSIVAAIGRFLAIFLGPSPFTPSSAGHAYFLTTIALLLDRDDIRLYRIEAKIRDLWSEFRLRKIDIILSYDNQSARRIHDARIYLGDFAFFVLGWVGLFHFHPDNEWVTRNTNHFWSVLLFLGALILCSRLYFGLVMKEYYELCPFIVSEAIKIDDTLREKLLATPEEMSRIQQTVEQQIADAAKEVRPKPTIVSYIRNQIPGFIISEIYDGLKERKQKSMYRVFDFENRLRAGRTIPFRA